MSGVGSWRNNEGISSPVIPLLIGVAGASGRVGRQVVELLIAERGIRSIVALSRQTVTSWAQRGVNHRRIDYSDETTLRTAFHGLDTLVFPASDGDHEQMVEHHRNVLATASWCNVRRLIYLSSLDIEQDSPFPYAIAHRATEELLEASGLEVCVLRASVFTEFFLDTFIRPALADGTLRLPAALGCVSFVSTADVAAALAAAAINKTEDRVFHITGPAALDLHDVAREISHITGRYLRYEVITVEAYRTALIHSGCEPIYVDAFTMMLFSSIPRGYFQLVSTDVMRLTHRHPEKFRDCVTRNMQ